MVNIGSNMLLEAAAFNDSIDMAQIAIDYGANNLDTAEKASIYTRSEAMIAFLHNQRLLRIEGKYAYMEEIL